MAEVLSFASGGFMYLCGQERLKYKSTACNPSAWEVQEGRILEVRVILGYRVHGQPESKNTFKKRMPGFSGSQNWVLF